jgi:methylated-DNA-[protein]-cysteine S-methyltransferase
MLFIPCHRVVAAGGLGGYGRSASGDPLDRKRWLLRREGVDVLGLEHGRRGLIRTR